MNIQIIPTGAFQENCAIMWEQQQAFIIDPGFGPDDIDSILCKNQLTVTAYLITHGHADHLNALATLHAKYPASVYIHRKDYKWAFGPQNQIPPYYPVPEKPDAEFIHPEEKIPAGIQCLETPGHTPGGISYYLAEEKIVFTGDTLFKGSCGRTDLPGGDGRILARSLQTLATLPDDVQVYAGHGEPTTIGHEKRTNFFMQQASRR